MRRHAPLRVVTYKHSSTSRFAIEGLRVQGKRKRLFFGTKAEAVKELEKLKGIQQREGERGLAIPDALRIAAMDCEEELKPYGKTIRDATRFYLLHLASTQRSLTVSALVEDFLQAQSRARRSKTHTDDLRQRLGRFAATFGERPTRSVTTEEAEGWLHGLGLGPQSTNNYRDRLAALFEYAFKREMIERNPIAAVERVTLLNEPPVIYTPEELKALLAAAPSDLVPAIALAAFAGLRSAELLRLDWSDVDLDRGFIEVSAAKAKTATRRLIPIVPNLAKWLRLHAQVRGKVYAKGSRQFHRATEDARKRAGIALKPNAARHSFASYRMAALQNGPQVAMEMGHASPAMTIRHYRELCTPAEAEAYWNIYPQPVADNVVATSAA